MAQFCQFDKFDKVESPLTGNIIYVNTDSELFLLRPKDFWDLRALSLSIKELRASDGWLKAGRASSEFRNATTRLMESPDESLLMRSINTLMAGRKNWGVIQRMEAGEAAKAAAVAKPWVLRDKTRILNMLVECLLQDDWSWAKTALGNPHSKEKGDWFFKTDENGGSWTWCPARAVCLYVKLRFPSRQSQTRHLDSGEADAKIALLDPDASKERCWDMVPNPHRVPSALSLVSLTRQEQQELHERFLGAVQVATAKKRNYLRLRFPTNKTADLGKDAWKRGYTSPWMPEELAHKLVELREWQIANNPIKKTTLWTEVDEFLRGDGKKHPELLRGMDSAFLFRDATNNCPDQPISDSKVHGLYLALCQEIERRCAAGGLNGSDGRPIRLIASYSRTGKASGLVYPLHSLRVSIATQYVETGGLSPEVMMKIVGQATVAMVMYYIKHNGEYVADIMAKADERISEKATRKWITEARDKELEALRRMSFATSNVAHDTFRSAPPNSLLPVDVGVCPTAGGRCHEGGARIFGRANEDLYAPVSGGDRTVRAVGFS